MLPPPADSADEKRNEKRNELESSVEKRNEKRNAEQNAERKILEVIFQYPGIQRKELSQRTGLSRGTLDRKLKDLKTGNNPQIEHRGPDKTGGWFIKS